MIGDVTKSEVLEFRTEPSDRGPRTVTASWTVGARSIQPFVDHRVAAGRLDTNRWCGPTGPDGHVTRGMRLRRMLRSAGEFGPLSRPRERGGRDTFRRPSSDRNPVVPRDRGGRSFFCAMYPGQAPHDHAIGYNARAIATGVVAASPNRRRQTSSAQLTDSISRPRCGAAFVLRDDRHRDLGHSGSVAGAGREAPAAMPGAPSAASALGWRARAEAK